MIDKTNINKERIQVWVNALRSGEYEQTDGSLRSQTGFCCLGVACHVSDIAAWETTQFGSVHYLGSTAILPKEVKEYYGLDNSSPFVFVNDNSVENLVVLNDTQVPFNLIADYIESTFLSSPS